MKVIKNKQSCIRNHSLAINIVILLLILVGCNKIAYLPEVTHSVAVTANTATISIEVDRGDDDCLPKIQYGRNMEFDSSTIVKAHVKGDHYEVFLDSLERNTTYYYRFIVSNSAGGYIIVENGDCFTTTNTLVVVTTMEIKDISWEGTFCNALAGGNVSEIGGVTITERGICWSKHNLKPSLEDDHVSCESGTGSFTATISPLEPTSVYYARAYAISSLGTSYGNVVSFATINKWEDGLLPGLFSVSSTQKVCFSQGNLQYIGSATVPYWKFAEKQWDYLGTNGPDSESQNIDRDLFGWGTSGYDHGAISYQPWCVAHEPSIGSPSPDKEYYAYGEATANLYDHTGKADWGHNAISNGGNQENSGWRTLTDEEWRYVLKTRNTPSGYRFVWATVNDIHGMILLPDNWRNDIFPLNNPNGAGYTSVHYDHNIINVSEWSKLERNGAVFLPASGRRNRTNIQYTNSTGYYWTSSYYDGLRAWQMHFTNLGFGNGYESRGNGVAVRLVKNM